MLRLFDYLPSGNGYKVRLLLQWLDIPYKYVDVDIEKGETRTADFLQKNPNGKIPVLQMEDGSFLWESNAILWHFAKGTPYLPEGTLEQAKVLQWLFFEQYSHEPNIATPRFWLTHGKDMTPFLKELLAQKQELGNKALAVMETHLKEQPYFVGVSPTIADIGLYGYTHVAEEGGFDLGSYPAVSDWLARIAAVPGSRPITKP